MVNYIDGNVDAKPTFHSRDESYLLGCDVLSLFLYVVFNLLIFSELLVYIHDGHTLYIFCHNVFSGLSFGLCWHHKMS